MLYHTLRSLCCSSHYMMKTMSFFFFSFFSFWKWSFYLWQSANLAKSCLALHNLLLRERTWQKLCNPSQAVLVISLWCTMSFHSDRKTSSLEWVHLMKDKCTYPSARDVCKIPKDETSTLFSFNYLWQKQLRMANAQLLPSHHSQCTSSSHKEQGCSMSAVNRNRGGKGKNKKVHKQDWHLYAGGGKRSLVSTNHTNTKPKENNAVHLGFHKLRSGRS